MTKKKPLPAAINDGYKQTDISIYFKVTNRASWNTKMLCTTNKENDSEEPLLSPRKNPKPICSDDETEFEDGESVVTDAVGSLNNGLPPAFTQPPKPVLRENRSPQRCPLNNITKLPLQLPVYTYSDDSDSEERSSDKPVSQPLDTAKSCRAKVKTRGNSQPTTPKSSPIKAGIKKNLKIKPIVVISSDEEDFEVTPRKVRKVEDTLLHRRKLTPQETTTKVKEYIASKIIPNVCNKFYHSSFSRTNEQEKEKLEDATVPILGPSTSKVTPQVISHTIGVHKPTTVPKTVVKRKPHILLEKNKSNPNLPSTSAEFISIDFSPKSAVEVLSTSIETISSNETIVYEQNTNFMIREGINSTPKKVKVLENILISSPVRTLDQCDLSPIKKDSGTESTIKQNGSSASTRNITKNIQDMTGTNSSLVAKEQFENSNWTTRLFTKIVKYIGSHSHLKTMLTGTESETLNRFFSMQQAEYQFFCFKLFTRIQKWYNIFKLRDELHMELSDPDMKNMYNCLYENKFVEIDFSTEPCIDLLNHLLVRDLKDICETFKIKLTNEKKCEIVEKLLTNCNRQATLTTKTTEKILRDKIKQKMGICVKLSSALYKLFKKVHLLYSFTTSDFATPSDLHFYLGRIMSNEIYMPKYKVNMNVKVFSSINQFSRFEEACECKRAMVESHEKKEIGHMLELGELAYTELRQILQCYEPNQPKSSYMMRFTAGYKYTKTLSLGAKHLGRHYPKKVEEWLTFLINQDKFCLILRGTWYDWLVMVQYQYLKQFETAANTLIEALYQKNLSKVSLQDLNYRAEAIKRSKARKISELMHNKICFVQLPPLMEWPSVEIDAQVVHNDSGKKGKRLYVKKTDQEQQIRTVEETALEYYNKHDYPNGFHCEGSLLKTLLFVLFWDIIYESAVVDAFILEIQYLPLDLMSQEFYTNRKEAIDRRLNEIRLLWPYDQLKGFMYKVWNEHAHEKSLIDDRLVDEPKHLYDIVMCIGRDKLASMLERIIKDFKAYHSGLPDLFVWSVIKQKCKFVEVKGERDKLSSKQKLWLDFLLSIGADAEVCHVHTVGSRTGRKVGKLKKEVKKQEK